MTLNVLIETNLSEITFNSTQLHPADPHNKKQRADNIMSFLASV